MLKKASVFGIYPYREMIAHAVNTLQSAGFRNTEISALFSENDVAKDFAHETSANASDGATTGVASGAVLGGALGWLAGVGALTIPGLGPFIATGAIMGALAGVGTGAAAGGMVGALIGFGLPEYEAKRYQGRITHGGILLSVHCEDALWTELAKHILETTGGQDIASSAEASADFAASERPHPRRAHGD